MKPRTRAAAWLVASLLTSVTGAAQPAPGPTQPPPTAPPSNGQPPTAPPSTAPPVGQRPDAQTAEELRELSLERLLEVRVAVASKKSEATLDAPGTVTTYTAEQIRTLGYFTIARLAEITPGFGLLRSDAFFLETRGVASGLNEKHLVLLDGMPINHPRNNAAIIEEELPLLFASKVEFLRGPASALYGTGAFSGVINVVTPELQKEGTTVESNVGLGLDEPNRNRLGTLMVNRRLMANVVNRNEWADFKLAIGYHANEASLRPTGTGSANLFRDNQQSLFMQFDQRLRTTFLAGLTYGALYLDRSNGYGPSFLASSDISNSHRFQSVIPYIKYDKWLRSNLRLHARLKLDFGDEAGSQANTIGSWTRGQPGLGMFQFDVLTEELDALAEMAWDFYKGDGKIIRQGDLTVGIEYNRRVQDGSKGWVEQSLEAPFNSPPDLPVFNQPANIYSMYAQLGAVVPVLSNLLLTLGLRSDNGNLGGRTYGNLSPRIAAVQKIGPDFSVKAMYATALRAPGIDAYSHNVEKQVVIDTFNRQTGSNVVAPTLSPETIQTLELALALATSKIGGTASIFYNILMNPLARLDVVPGLPTDLFVNVPGSSHVWGVEGEVRAVPMRNLRLTGNVSYAHTPNEGPPFSGAPVVKLNFVGDYTAAALANLNTAIVVKGVTAYRAIPVPEITPLLTADKRRQGTVVVDLALHLPASRQATVGIEIRNLLGRDLFPYEPDGVTPRPQRTIWLVVNWKG